MFRPTMSASLIPSRCFTSARSELPCATTSTVRPAARSGTIASSQYGSNRATTSRKHSVLGSKSPVSSAYLGSPAWDSGSSSGSGGGGTSYERRQRMNCSSPNSDLVCALFLPSSPPRLGDALLGQAHVHPASEQSLGVPHALAMAYQHQSRHGCSVSPGEPA